MFISCRGLRILVELLDEDYVSNRTLILSALEGIGSVFDLQSPTPRNDFCRMFVREGILDPLSTALLSILRDTDLGSGPEVGKGKGNEGEGIREMVHADRAMGVLLLFCQVAQADMRVREAFANRTIVIREYLPRRRLTPRPAQSVRVVTEKAARDRHQGDQAPVNIAAAHRGAAELECNGGARRVTRQDISRFAQQCGLGGDAFCRILTAPRRSARISSKPSTRCVAFRKPDKKRPPRPGSSLCSNGSFYTDLP
jgi:hypothetical protein